MGQGDENMKSCDNSDDGAQRPCFLTSSPVVCLSIIQAVLDRNEDATQQNIEICENSDDGVQKPFFLGQALLLLMWVGCLDHSKDPTE